MKILYFNYLYDLKGSSLGSAIKPMELFTAIQELGHTVRMCWMKKQPQGSSTKGKSRRQNFKKILSYYLYDLKVFLSNAFYFKKGLRIANAFKPDLIISRLDRCIFADLILAKIKGLPFILEGDSPVVYEAQKFQKRYKQLKLLNQFIEKINVRFANEVIVVSKGLKQYFQQYGILPRRVHIVTNGAVPNKFSPRVNPGIVRKKYNIGDNIVLGFVGSFSSWHGIQNLADLTLQISTKSSNVKFLLVGEGGRMKSWLEDFIHTHNLQNVVIFTGYVEHKEIPQYVAAMDIVLAPYPNLQFFYYSPVKIFEYLAAGKPVVTTRIGQIAEIITDGVDGVLCEPDDLNGTINRIEELIDQPKLRQNIGVAARENILRHHVWKEKAKEWEKICLALLEPPQKKGSWK